jgi:hypothetical protein
MAAALRIVRQPNEALHLPFTLTNLLTYLPFTLTHPLTRS